MPNIHFQSFCSLTAGGYFEVRRYRGVELHVVVESAIDMESVVWFLNRGFKYTGGGHRATGAAGREAGDVVP